MLKSRNYHIIKHFYLCAANQQTVPEIFYTFCTSIVWTGSGCSWWTLPLRKLLKRLPISRSNSRANSGSCFAVQDSLFTRAFNPVRTKPDVRVPFLRHRNRERRFWPSVVRWAFSITQSSNYYSQDRQILIHAKRTKSSRTAEKSILK